MILRPAAYHLDMKVFRKECIYTSRILTAAFFARTPCNARLHSASSAMLRIFLIDIRAEGDKGEMSHEIL